MSRPHILVLEDSDDDFETLQHVADDIQIRHAIVRVRSGGECLRLLRSVRQAHDTVPLMLLLDLNTPGDDGREVLRQMRIDEVLCTLPVVVLSASPDPRDLAFCYANGANAYHIKPVDHAAHRRVLRDIFNYWLGSIALPPPDHREAPWKKSPYISS